MPVYGLNVTSMLKHKTLVLTVDAVNSLEEKLLFALRRFDVAEKKSKSSTHGHSVA
jgi:large subunit ribosomal protein L4